MIRYAFHPEARVDLDEIWEFIRAGNLDAADRIVAENPVGYFQGSVFSESRPQTT